MPAIHVALSPCSTLCSVTGQGLAQNTEIMPWVYLEIAVLLVFLAYRIVTAYCFFTKSRLTKPLMSGFYVSSIALELGMRFFDWKMRAFPPRPDLLWSVLPLYVVGIVYFARSKRVTATFTQ